MISVCAACMVMCVWRIGLRLFARLFALNVGGKLEHPGLTLMDAIRYPVALSAL